jgi:hypothetical protein
MIDSGLSVLSGKVTNLTATSTVQGSIKKGKGRVNTSHKTSFRIDGKAASFPDQVNLADEDDVTLVGKIKGGEFHARVLQNNQTGVVYSGWTTGAYITGGILTFAGIPLSFVLIGIPLLAAGGWLIYQGYMNQKALSLLSTS